MVKPKDKGGSLFDFLRQERETLDRESPILATRHFVVEHTPPKRYWHSDEWSDAKSVRVSPYFETQEEAEAWREKHEPDEGNELRLRSENLREYKHKRWGI